jgi:hypothetical protein
MLTALLSLLALTGAAHPPATPPGRSTAPAKVVGHLLNVVGPVEIRREREGIRKGVLLFPLQKGDVIAVGGKGAAEIVFYETGGRYLLPANSSGAVEQTGIVRRSGPASRALRRLALPRPPTQQPSPRILGHVLRASSRNLGGAAQPRLKGVTPNGPVRGQPVALKWLGELSGVAELQVRVRDEEKTVYQTTVKPNVHEVVVPAGMLEVGQYYIWTVTGVGEDGAQKGGGDAWVRILPPGELAALEVLERDVAESSKAEPDNPAPLLLLAMTYERFGMMDEAGAVYERVRKLRPDDPGIQAAIERLGTDG